MLGQLEYTVEKCEKAYDVLAEKLFNKKQTWLGREDDALLRGKSLYNHAPLQDEVKRMVKEKFGDENMKMRDAAGHPNKTSACKVQVFSS